jgi:hypothetical protein
MPETGATLDDYVGFLRYLAEATALLHGPPVLRATCPECGAVWSLWKTICPSSPDFAAGYRGIWKCENPECGEMELR